MILKAPALAKRMLAAMAFGLALSTAAAAADVTLRFHHFLPQQANVPTHILDAWAERVETDSDGRIEVQMFPSMQLGGTPPELYDQAVDGIADIIWTLPGYTPGRFPRTEVFELPFIMDNAVAASKAYWQLVEEEMLNADFSDVHVIGVWVHGPGVIHSKVPIRELDDLVGVKLRAPTRVTNQLVSDLGATAVGMPVPAVPESLSKGVIEATALPWETTQALRVPELVSTHTEFEGPALYTATFLVAMNKQRYDALPDDLRAVLDSHSGMAFAEFAASTHVSYDAPVREAAIERGNQIITISREQSEAWQAAADATRLAWIEEMEALGIDGEGLINRVRALMAEFGSGG